MTFDDLMREILAILPNATAGEDNDGQVVIYTNLKSVSSDGHLVDMDTEVLA